MRDYEKMRQEGWIPQVQIEQELSQERRAARRRFQMRKAQIMAAGWYESGRAFIAKEDELMTYKEAYKTFVPKHSFNMYNYFYDGLTKYKKTIDGIVRYLINKYNS